MHGDDLANSGVQIVTQAASKTTEIICELIKMYLQNRNSKPKEINLHGEQKMLSALQKGGESDSVTLTRDDFERFQQINKEKYKNDVPYFSAEQTANSNYVDLYFLKSDDAAVKTILNDIVSEKMNLPDQEYKMVEVDKNQAECFQQLCTKNDISFNFMKTEQGSIKCVFNISEQEKMNKTIDELSQLQDSLKQINIEIKKDDNGKPKFIISDAGQNKTIQLNFCDKEKFQRVMQSQFKYEKEKAVAAACSMSHLLTSEQLKFYQSGSKLMERLDHYEKNIKFEDDNVLVNDYSFTQIKAKNEDMRLTITDKDGNFVVLSQENTDRKLVEENLRKYLQLDSTEKINALLEKAEKLKYVDAPEIVKVKEYTIERTSKNSMTVSDGNKSIDIDISNHNTAKSVLTNNFGMSSEKAEKIIRKAKKQSVTENLLKRAKSVFPGNSKPEQLRNKNMSRGSRK